MTYAKIYFTFLLLTFSFLSSGILFSQETLILSGTVIDTDSKITIPGATLRVLNTEKGTYSSSSGKFRLPIPAGATKLKVTSLGYETKIIELTGITDTLYIKLKPSSIKMKSVDVTGKIDANEIIKRAIERKEDNLKKLKTFSGTLYSKLVLELEGSIFGGSTQGGIQIGSTIGETAPEKFKMFVLETFSKTYKDFDKNITHTDIIQRRQTSNIPPQQNLLAIGNFMNFFDDEIDLLNTKIPTPLSNSAFSFYNFELIERNNLDDRFVYLLRVHPVTNTYPAFTGTISIVEGTYNLIDVSLQPSQNTAIPFLDSLKFLQKFEESPQGVWYPSFLEVTANARVDIIKGLLDAKAYATATSIFSETIINEPLPDSIYDSEKPRLITVSKGADSIRTEFWENNSLREITPREIRMYHEVDSLSAISDSLEKEKSSQFFDYLPDLRFNRVCSIGLGAWASLFYKNVSLNLNAYYSFGQKKPFGEVSLNINNIIDSSFIRFDLYGKYFSDIGNISSYPDYPFLVNTITSALFHDDYFDYYKKTGWGAGANVRLGFIRLNGYIELSKQDSLLKTTNNSIFSTSTWRNNPAIVPDNYRIISGGFSFNTSSFLRNTDFNASLKYNAMYGDMDKQKSLFRLMEAELKLVIPTFYTGYTPMNLELICMAGKSCVTTPYQYQFRMATKLSIIGQSAVFYSAPIGLYGGNEYFAGHFNYNLTDLWWRAIGLPRYEGRGIDLILSGSSARYFTPSNSYYKNTGNNYYSEIGFGLSRIPTFISNVGFLSFDARWGIGPLSHDNFGWGIGLSLPF
ncbi:MAG: carboxypeptidase-like regulatory domain-containing protein [Ignavibacteriae bacterium]|nr:carboxypeptidase-like regulatory domain-containing protein [Ignavibacteriota bacterium]